MEKHVCALCCFLCASMHWHGGTCIGVWCFCNVPDNKNKFKFLLISLTCSVGTVGAGFMWLLVFTYCVLHIINVSNKVPRWLDLLDVCVCSCVCVCEWTFIWLNRCHDSFTLPMAHTGVINWICPMVVNMDAFNCKERLISSLFLGILPNFKQ